MSRLDTDRQNELEPIRMQMCYDKLTSLGYDVTKVGTSTLRFTHKGHVVTLYPYSGWFTGKSVTDGRGFSKLLKQLTWQS